ncbi:MAG: DUF3367 domain-containing protein [Acidimicrobiales bacterium]|nr:DUF3367 domain-containing protein [Acidimicrobiales bacterium]
MATLVARRRPSLRPQWDAVALVVVAYLPFLLSAPGRLASDSKQALYVAPSGFLREALSLWDPGVGAGTVPHQHLGYLWPMGPWFWFFDLIRVPDWIAQRLWLGTITFAAAMGVRWLVRSLGHGRAAALAAAFVYASTPYQFAFTAQMSVLLLPWAGLPWLFELTRRALHRGGWRHPAAFALVVFTVAGVNAPTLLLVGLGPCVLIVADAVRGNARRAAGTAVRIAAVTVPMCAAWIAALRVQSAYGMDILAVTENLRTVSSRSSPDDVLRGLGNWFFYGGDRLGPAVVQSPYYDTNDLVVLASLVVPAIALAALSIARWRGRGVALAMVAAAVVAVGAWPYDHPSLYGRAFRWFTESSSAGLAFRNAPRIVPLVVLGMALAVSAAVRAMPMRIRAAFASVVCLAALAGLSPVLKVGMLSPPAERPQELPGYWKDATRYLDGRGEGTRVLALPGANFAAYRWGNAIEPIAPLLLDRPFIAREVLPQGSSESALLLDALDRRLQNGVLDPSSIAPVARLLGVGDVLVRSDLAIERFGLPTPSQVWSTIAEPPAPGLDGPVAFGSPSRPSAPSALVPLVPSDLSPTSPERTLAIPPVAVLSVRQPQPIVRVASADGPILLGGDADGIVDAAAAGVVDGRRLVVGSAALTNAQFDDVLGRSPHLLLTDSNRRRIQTWFYSLRDTRGPTERAGEVIVEPTGYDSRLHSYPNETDADRSVVEQFGATVTATDSGGAARPADRPTAALDGSVESSWRIGGADPTGNHLTVTLQRPRRIDRLTIVQPQDGPRDRVLTKVRIRTSNGPAIDVTLDGRSLTRTGQVVTFPARTTNRIDVELTGVSTPPFDPSLANAVGIAELRIADLTVTETVRLPSDLLGRAGARSSSLPLDVVLTRLRRSADDWTRQDEERLLDRTFALPSRRTFSLSGTIRVSDSAPDDLVDTLFGTDDTVRATSSSRLQGSPGSRASRVLDGDRSTAWTAAFGTGAGSWIDLTGVPRHSVDALRLAVVADGRHSLPKHVTVLVDGRKVASRSVPLPKESSAAGHVTTVEVPFERPVTAERIRVVFDATYPRSADGTGGTDSPLPVSIAEIEGTGWHTRGTGSPRSACRSDLLEVDGQGIAVRVAPVDRTGTATMTSCGSVALARGTHRLRSAIGSSTGWNVDALRLRSDGSDDEAVTKVPGADGSDIGASVTSSTTGMTEVRATVDAGTRPFWFVLGQSSNRGWKIQVDGGSAGPRTVVDGYANGWLITPASAGRLHITVTWTPQRTVVGGLVTTAAMVVLSLLILLRTSPDEKMPVPSDAPAFIGLRDAPRSVTWTSALVAAVATAVFVGLVSRAWIGFVAGCLAFVVSRRPAVAWAAAVLAPVTLLVARFGHRPELGWLALGVVVAAAVPDLLNRRRRPSG